MPPSRLSPTDAAPAAHRLTDLEDLIPVRIARMSEIFQRVAAAAFSGFGLRVTDLRILNVLHGEEAIPVAEISRRARVDKAWISRLVRELENKGLVARSADPADTRAMLVSLTPAGRQLQRDILPLARAHESDVLGKLDRKTLVAMLDELEARSLRLLDASTHAAPAGKT